MKENLNKQHLYSLDFLKFIAAIFITNSHFQPLYEGVNTAFATFVKIDSNRLTRKIKTLLYSLLLKRSKLLENKQKTI